MPLKLYSTYRYHPVETLTTDKMLKDQGSLARPQYWSIGCRSSPRPGSTDLASAGGWSNAISGMKWGEKSKTLLTSGDG